MNNLLERLHASFYFYIMTGPTTFIQIGNYLPSAVLVAAAMMFAGLKQWVDAGWTKSQTQKYLPRRRPSVTALFVMFATHAIGFTLFLCLQSSWYSFHPQVSF
jgi:glycosylphosphatidylinositol transamidase